MIKYKIYCDQDGVLADFDKQFKELTGSSPSEYEKIYGRDKFWEIIKQEGEEFWSNIPKMPDMEKLWYYISKYNPPLLTAPSRERASKTGKKKWVSKYIPETEIIFSPAREKKQYAAKDHILIDDNKQNIKEWEEAGGIGILHTSARNTIKQLKSLGL